MKNDDISDNEQTDANERQTVSPPFGPIHDGNRSCGMKSFSSDQLVFLAHSFQVMQRSIPNRVINAEAMKAFSNLPENKQIEALQQNIVQTISIMACAEEVGANFGLSLMAALAEVCGADKMRTVLEFLESRAQGFVLSGEEG